MSEGYAGPVFRCPWYTRVYSSERAAEMCCLDDD